MHELVMFGQTPSGLKRKLEQSVIDFVFGKLSEWRDTPARKTKTAEEALNSQLCRFLDNAARKEDFSCLFQHEAPQGIRRRIDIAATPVEELLEQQIYASICDDDIIVFEAKRLPAPGGKMREKEYVTGGSKISGGIQRFKSGVHGQGHIVAAMIGYIQKKDADYFYRIINKWILEFSIYPLDDLSWDSIEILKNFSYHDNGTARLLSVHPRTEGANIELHHLWVEMPHRKS